MTPLYFINKYQEEIIFDLKISKNFNQLNCKNCLLKKCDPNNCKFEKKDFKDWYNIFQKNILPNLIDIWNKRFNIITQQDFIIESTNYSNILSSEIYGSNFETDESFFFIIENEIFILEFTVNFNNSYSDGTFINDITNINIDNLSQDEILKFIETHFEKVKNDDNKDLLQFIVDISN
jgi:hypothetical protein